LAWIILLGSLIDIGKYWERVLDKRYLDNRKATPTACRADKGRLKRYILPPSAVKINCKSFCEVGYANFSQTFFVTARGCQQRFGYGWG